MADLQETLNKRERRSRIVAFVIGIAIIAVLLILFVVFNADDDGESATSDVSTEQVADSEGTNEENVFDVFEEDANGDAPEETTEEGQTSSSSTETAGGDAVDGEVAVDDSAEADTETTTVATTGASDNLPNTGPAENALAGVVAIVVAGYYFARSKKILASSLK